MVGLIILIILVGLAVAIMFSLSGGKRVCPFCHTMMPKKAVKCPHCRKGIPIGY